MEIDTPHKIKDWMAGYGYSVKTLTQLMGVKKSAVYAWLSGETRIPGLAVSWIALHERLYHISTKQQK